ncbi:MAG: ATP-binding protein [Myxococcales bacterium]
MTPSDPSPSLLRAVVDHLSAMVAYWDADQRCRFANRAYEKWFGVDPRTLVGKEMRELLGPLYALNLPYIEGVLRGEAQEFEREIPDPAGGAPRHSLAQYIPDVVDGQVRGFYVLVTDITRLKRAERALREAEHQLESSARLDALATLAAGIAHEINNPLAAILAHTELALESLSGLPATSEALATDLREARNNTLRVRDIVRSMRLLARGEAKRDEQVDVSDTLRGSIELVQPSLRYRARVVRELGAGLYVRGNASQLAQVFVNLLSNAAQALPEQPGRANEIRVSTRREGDLIVSEVSDNGCGIPRELQERVFEPFFTTKGVGAGMGLGLSISKSIIEALGGALSVASEPGRGSVFRIVLPAAPAAAPQASKPFALPASPRTSTPSLAVARPRVLVIDDELAVARTLERILARDCDVVIKNHGQDALALLGNEQEPAFDLVLCDLMMPEPSGQAIYEKVHEQRPELAERFVFITGGAFTAKGRQFLESVPVAVLEKPFDLARLRAVVAAYATKA